MEAVKGGCHFIGLLQNTDHGGTDTYSKYKGVNNSTIKERATPRAHPMAGTRMSCTTKPTKVETTKKNRIVALPATSASCCPQKSCRVFSDRRDCGVPCGRISPFQLVYYCITGGGSLFY